MRSFYFLFLKRLLILSIIIALISTLLWVLLPLGFLSPALPFLIIFFFSVALISHYFQLKSISGKLIRFVNAYLLLMIAKLFLYLVIIIAYVMLNRAEALPFMINFLVLYLFYTIFEVYSLLSLKGKS